MKLCFVQVFLAVLIRRCLPQDNDLTYLKAFDDTIVYRLMWDKEQEDVLKNEADNEKELETITMVTARKEKYVCALPHMQEMKHVSVIYVSHLLLNIN